MNKISFAFSMLFVAFLMQFGFAQNVQTPLLIIGNDSIYADEFISTYSKNNDFKSASEQELRDYLELFTTFKMKVKEGEELKVDTVRRFVMELKSYEKQSAQQYLVDKEVTNALLQEAYDRALHYIRASHILFACAPNADAKDTLAAYNKALDIRNRILNDEFSFAAAAALYSDDPSARDFVNPQTGRLHVGNSGDLGYFTVFDLVYPFETGAYNTPVGHISLPVRTQFGYHLIEVNDKIEAVKSITIKQIYLNDTAARIGKMLPTTKERVLAIQEELKNGKTFEELAPIYSEDNSTATNGGLMEPFAPNRRQADFVKTVLKLKVGEISEPIPSQTGWHFVKLVEIEKYELTDEHQLEIKNQISRDNRTYKSKESFVAKMKKEYNYDDKNLAKGLKYIYSKLPDDFFTAGYTGTPAAPAGIEKVKPLCTFGDTSISAAFFFKHLSRYRGLELSKTDAMNFMTERFNFIVQEKLTQYEYAHLVEKYPEYKALQKEFHDGMVLYEMNTNKVWSAAVADSVGIEKFYREHQDKYMDTTTAQPLPLDSVRATVITDYQDFLDKQWIEELRAKYKPVVNDNVFENLLKR